MADPTGIFPVSLEQNKPEGERDKRRRLTTLMESLRSRTSQHKTWVDCVKAVRTAISDKRHQPDALDKGHLQRCLDSLQRAIKVISQQSLIERLETVARQLSLSSSIQPGPEQHLIISSDMFHVQIIFDKGGGVKDVKVAHGGEANSCQELVEVLSRRDFVEFASHLEGLLKIYQIVGDKKVKSKAFLSLQSLESDLNLLAQLQSSINGVGNYIHKSPLGILLPRKGGLPMKLIYFVSPYDLLDKKSKSAHAMTVEAITEHGLGQSVTVCLEAATPNKLQTMPLMTVVNRDGKGIPSFQGLTHVNSFTFPACFVLELPEPIPLALSMIQKIQSHTNMDIEKSADPKPLLSLIMEKYSNGKTLNEKELFVSLPDQQHVYFMNNVNGSSLDQPGVMVSRIPFTHPMNVAHILSHLRQQLVFNTVVSSCIRPNSKQDMANAVVIELTTISLQQICITMEHPVYDSMLNVELDLGDITSLKCRLSSGHTDQVLCTDDFASRVFQRCLSIPITLRSIIKKGREQLQKLLEERLAAMKMALWQRNNRPQPTQTPSVHTRGRQPVFVNPALSQVPQQMAPMQQMQHQVSHHHMPHPMAHQMSHHHHHQLQQQQQQHQLQVNQLPPPAQMTDMRGPMQDMRGQMQDVRSSIADLLSPPLDKIGNNPLLAGLLDQEHDGSSQEVNDSPMLSKLLEDQTTGAASSAAAAAAAAAAVAGSLPMANATKPTALHKRVRKRRSTSDQLGRSPKHRLSDGEGNDKITTIDLDSSCSPFDSSLQSSSGLPPSAGLQSIIDLTEDSFGESNLKKLADSMDSLIPKDQKQATDSELTALLSDGDPGRSLLSKNSSPGSKNENASTSLEDLLAGSGEGNEALDPASSLSSSSSSIASDKNSGRNAAFLGFKSSSPRQDSKSPISASFHKEVFSPDRERSDPLHSAMFDRTAFDLPETKYSVKTPPIKTESSTSDRREITGLFEKFEKLKNENVEPVGTSIVKSEEGKGLKLKLPALRHSDSRSAPQVSMESLSSKSLGKQSNVGTFDFKSDEDEDEPLPSLSGSERLAVYAASPTRLQITNKSKNSYDTSSRRKSEKYKRKESKYGSSGESVKRKRGKDESKKERKKRKLGESNQYSSVAVNKTVYHAATVESDQKSVTKLKIRVSKEPSFKIEEDTSKKSSKHSSTPVVDKLIVSKHDLKDPDIISSHKSQSSSQKSLHRSSSLSQRSASPNQSQGNSVSKSDPKLATKTTIRLKPLNIPNSGSSVTVQTDKKSPSALSTAKSLTSTKTSVSNSSRPQTPIVSKVSLSPSPVRTPTSSPSKLASQSSGKSSSSKSLTSSKSSSSLPKPPTSLSLSKNPVSNLSKSPSASNSPKSVTSASTKSSTPTSSAKTPTTPVTAKNPSSSSKSHSSSPARPSSQNPKLSSSQTLLKSSSSSTSSSSGSPKTSTSSSKSSSSNRSVSSSSNKSSKTQTSSSSRPQSSSTKSQSSSLTKSSSSSSSSKDKNTSKTSSMPKSSNASSSSSSKNSSTSGPSLPAALSIASFLPDAPTASSVASLPPIPKLSSSSSSSSGTSHNSNPSQGSGASSSKDLSTNTSGAAPNPGGTSTTSASHSSKALASNSSASATKVSSGSASGNTSSKSNATVNSKPVESSSASEGAGGNGSSSGSGDAGANKGKLPAARSRKGSLSAVIDKLTKSSTTSVHVSTMTPGEVLAKQAREKAEQENRALAEQRAARSDNKAQDHVLNSAKTERDKGDSGDNRNRIDSQNKRNMSVGSSNKDSPKVLSSVNNKVSRNEMIKLGQNSSPLNKVVTSENNSVSSSPRTNSLGSSRSVGRASPVNKEALKNRDSPVGRASPGGKSSPGIKDSPGRQSASTNSVLDGKDKVNAFSKDDNRNRRQSVESGRSGSPVTGNKPVGNVSNNKKSELSDKGSIKGGSVSPLTIQNVQNVGVEKRSPSQKHCTSPLVFNNTKFNGESSREKTPNKEEREAFKVPTPKASTPETRDMDELECLPRKKQRVNKNVSSPHSDASSPENGLVIDCPGTPKINSNGASPMSVLESPVKDAPAPLPPTDGKQTPVKSSTVSSSPKSKVHQSPRPSQSPAGVKVTSNSETPGSGDTRHSPCEIDDELMDEALMGLNS